MPPKILIPFAFVLGLAVMLPVTLAQDSEHSEREEMYRRYLEFPSYVKGGKVEPHWMADGSSFWYAEAAPANTVIWKVHPVANTKVPLFDTARLRKALAGVLDHEPPYKGLPFDEFTFVDKSEKAVKFTVENKDFILQLDTHTITRAPALSEKEKARRVPQLIPRRLFEWGEIPFEEVPSPDGLWFAGVKDHNLYIRSTKDDQIVKLTTDGQENYTYYLSLVGHYRRGRAVRSAARAAAWSADSSKLAIIKYDLRQAEKRPLVHWLKPIEEFMEWYYPADSAKNRRELFIIDIHSKRQIQVDAFWNGNISLLGWRSDGSELLFARLSADHKKLDLVAADSIAGSTRVLVSERQETFVIGIERWNWRSVCTLLEARNRFIWASEKDGWRHLYLYDMDGNFIRQLTRGKFPVVEVVAVDQEDGWVYFTAHGDRHRPYDIHLYRVNLQGERFTRLTAQTGQHDVQFAPSGKFFLDAHSSIDRPSAVELRRADGTLLQVLQKANIDRLKELNWKPPEEFVVKAADETTDLYGVLYKPYDFDQGKEYPVIEVIYAGPQFSEVPHTFTHPHGIDFHAEHGQALAQLGFISYIVDGRGTPERGKAFQDVVYGNLGRYEIADHVSVLRQLAEKRPYMDLSRVGILGKSYGGYFTVRALLQAPDVYHVGVAIAGFAGGDDREDLYLGPREQNKEAYEYRDNRRLVENLRGKLLLIQGTSDNNVTFFGLMRMLDALVEAGKPYDLIVLPEETHYFTKRARPYVFEAIRRYFQEHLNP